MLWDKLGPGITTAGPADSKFSLSFRTGKLGRYNSWQVISPGPSDGRVRDVHRQHNNERKV